MKVVFREAWLLALISLQLIAFSCTPDKEVEAEKIRAIMASISEAHFQKSAEQFLEHYKDSFIDVRNGTYYTLHKSEELPAFQSYLSATDFLELEQAGEPIIHLSEDATLATYTGTIYFRAYMGERPFFSRLAWVATLNQVGDGWQIIQNINSELPEAELGPVILNRVISKMGSLSDSLIIKAEANCTGPSDDFRTLLVSGPDHGRMEQQSSDGHLILQHGKDSQWIFDASSDKLENSLDEQTASFITGHEFHRLSLRPLDRLHQPVFRGYTDFDGRTAFIISFKNNLDSEVHLYYDFENYLPLGFDFPSPFGSDTIHTYFKEWTEINGIPMVSKVIIDEGDNQWTYDFTDLSFLATTEFNFEEKEALLSQTVKSAE